MVTFADEHDFEKYPELSNTGIDTFGFASPHMQIETDFFAKVVKVHDGDTVTLRAGFRDFDFPLRFLSVDCPELNTGVPGQEARDFVKDLILNEDVAIKINKNNRVDKYGRLLGDVIHRGLNVSELLLQFGYALPFTRRAEGQLPDLNKELAVKKWL